MKRFVKFEIHEYMDMYPENHIRMMEGENEDAIQKIAIGFAQHMNRNYSGGTTTFIKVMNKEEAQAHVDKLADYEKNHPKPDSDEFIEGVRNLFNKCYSDGEE